MRPYTRVDATLLLRNLTCALVGLMLAGAPASAQQLASLDVALPIDAAPAPEFSPSTKARLTDVINTATNVPVWPGQIGPAPFVDHFSGRTLDPRWNKHDRAAQAPWIENDWRPENVKLNRPGLSLVMDRSKPGSKSPLSSGEINRYELVRYGYFESRFKVPRGAGVITAFFTYVREDGTRKTWNELDIEILGRDTRTIELTVHVEGKSVNRKIDLGFDAADDFHTYAIEWRPDAVLWYVDNKLVHSVTGHLVEKIRRPQKMHIDVWGTDELRKWAGKINPKAGPWELEVSCMAYRPSYSGSSLCSD